MDYLGGGGGGGGGVLASLSNYWGPAPLPPLAPPLPTPMIMEYMIRRIESASIC